MISIHALLAESDAHNFSALHNILISIHALLAESDNSSYGALDGASISIHALLAESDRKIRFVAPDVSSFLSTLSLRRATSSIEEVSKYVVISIHALLAESDK